MKILVATNHLYQYGGSETYTFTLIEEINRRKNFDVEYFTFKKGSVSERIENQLGVKFLSKEKYDLILANHNSCVEKLYGMGFIIQTCHGIFPSLEQPSDKADAYVSISQEVQSHLADKGYSSKIILNGLNLNRFKPKNPVSKNLRNVLSLCHSVEANSFIEEICKLNQWKFLKAYKYDSPLWEIENKINEADIVIGLGRSAYEAMACGRPVVIFDKRRYSDWFGDGYVKNILGLSLINNCSGRYFKYNFSSEDLELEIKKFRKNHSVYFREFAEKELDIVKNTDKYLEYFEFLQKNQKTLKRKLWITLSKFYIGNYNLSKILFLKKRILKFF
ncbi:UDP-glycosyltransferase [Zunongwangia sp. F363]|uniref:UDP-glycosyltransferase n=1 Tax=Autumnicola tepida TaxID=3075595 RepID=A0ABU3C9M8_9FLAO|nr:UDP-glycosyltransferase [Zunongwangia sp. F363]MDT0643053.1 UDP-glycosyltransferase [Zunongwangia sp. F363]